MRKLQLSPSSPMGMRFLMNLKDTKAMSTPRHIQAVAKALSALTATDFGVPTPMENDASHLVEFPNPHPYEPIVKAANGAPVLSSLNLLCEPHVHVPLFFFHTAGDTMPMHNHPGMSIVSKVLYGRLRYRCWRKFKLDTPPNQYAKNSNTNINFQDLKLNQRDGNGDEFCKKHYLELVSEKTLSDSDVIVHDANEYDLLHEMEAVVPSCFVDVLAPPYGDGRECVFYKPCSDRVDWNGLTLQQVAEYRGFPSDYICM